MSERSDFIGRLTSDGWDEIEAGMIYDHHLALAKLRNRLAEAERERDRYRVALAQYADAKSWMIRDYDGANCDYIGEGEGPELALRALGAAREMVTKSAS